MIVWDAENPATDVVLIAGLEVTRALCARAKIERDAEEADFEAIEGSILEIEKQAGGLDEITKLTGTIKSNSEKILKRAEIMRQALSREVEELGEKVEELKALLADDVAANEA